MKPFLRMWSMTVLGRLAVTALHSFTNLGGSFTLLTAFPPGKPVVRPSAGDNARAGAAPQPAQERDKEIPRLLPRAQAASPATSVRRPVRPGAASAGLGACVRGHGPRSVRRS